MDGNSQVNIFLAIENLIGNNSRHKINLKNQFMIDDLFDTQIEECHSFLDKAKNFKYVLKTLFIKKSEITTAFVTNSN